MIGKDAQRDDESQYVPRNDLIIRWGVFNPLAVRPDLPKFISLHVDSIERSIAFRRQVGGCVGRSALSRKQWRFCRRGIEIGFSTPGLHIRVRLFQKKITCKHGNNKQSRAYEIGQQVRKLGKETGGREHGREIGYRFGKITPDGSCKISKASRSAREGKGASYVR